MAASTALRSFSSWVRKPLRWSEFSRGLVTGLAFALLVIALFTLHTRQRIGGALIWLGERMDPTPQPHMAPSAPPGTAAAAPKLTDQPVPVSVASSPPRSSTASAPKMTVPPKPASPAAATPASTPPLSDEKPPLPTPKSVAPRIHSKSASATVPAPAVPSPSIPSLPLPSTQPASVLVPAEDAHLASPENILAAKAVDRTDENENAEDVLEINSGMILGTYFEVGKFKDQLAGNQRRHDLEKLGFRTVVLPKRLLWMKSYEVLVGPYHDQKDAQGARRNLQADGFEPRSPGGHSRQLTLVVPWERPFGGATDQDDFVVTWQAYSGEANVKFVEGGQIGRTVTGKWVKLPSKSEYTGIVYTTGRAGERTLLSIQFRGMNQAVMLPNSADRSIVF